MYIRKILLKNFRCFTTIELTLDKRIMLIAGLNGSGKTTLLEALHYACYLRSFRATASRDLIRDKQHSFFIKLLMGEDDNVIDHEVQVGFSGKKKLVKIDQRPVQSFKELTHYYRVITLTEDDLALIKGGPEERRMFIDQAIGVFNPDYLTLLRSYKVKLNNRNALLQQAAIDKHSYLIWSEQLWQASTLIQQARRDYLEQLEQRINKLVHTYLHNEITIVFSYQAKKQSDVWQSKNFSEQLDSLYHQERAMKRSLFGAHLDDIGIHFKGAASKVYASRGQQKLIVLLLKIAQLQELIERVGSTIFLLDDFMTDFDLAITKQLIVLLSALPVQLIFTSPVTGNPLETFLLENKAKIINLTG